jgi:hypothetical protein
MMRWKLFTHTRFAAALGEGTQALAAQAAYFWEKLSHRITACQKLRKQDD